MKSFLFVCLCFIAVAHGDIILGEDDEWKAFKVQYGKEYRAEEELYRKEIFKSNLKVCSSLYSFNVLPCIYNTVLKINASIRVTGHDLQVCVSGD